ncbi:DNA polymerase I superfamily [Klebsormidium nitens]|uniref:DNA-directed DNA polymerase n=1 Tax=Klebsormidium nitens TaxID=105231 RepID=A0A1Y1IJC3_KLENI|nr:DNA polymerase I superfamily [Klebsormidium nitens]|eukprot:GAQ90985.1 DNA polymerase I superfamily [Klebsormidium nitens]
MRMVQGRGTGTETLLSALLVSGGGLLMQTGPAQRQAVLQLASRFQHIVSMSALRLEMLSAAEGPVAKVSHALQSYGKQGSSSSLLVQSVSLLWGPLALGSSPAQTLPGTAGSANRSLPAFRPSSSKPCLQEAQPITERASYWRGGGDWDRDQEPWQKARPPGSVKIAINPAVQTGAHTEFGRVIPGATYESPENLKLWASLQRTDASSKLLEEEFVEEQAHRARNSPQIARQREQSAESRPMHGPPNVPLSPIPEANKEVSSSAVQGPPQGATLVEAWGGEAETHLEPKRSAVCDEGKKRPPFKPRKPRRSKTLATEVEGAGVESAVKVEAKGLEAESPGDAALTNGARVKAGAAKAVSPVSPKVPAARDPKVQDAVLAQDGPGEPIAPETSTANGELGGKDRGIVKEKPKVNRPKGLRFAEEEKNGETKALGSASGAGATVSQKRPTRSWRATSTPEATVEIAEGEAAEALTPGDGLGAATRTRGVGRKTARVSKPAEEAVKPVVGAVSSGQMPAAGRIQEGRLQPEEGERVDSTRLLGQQGVPGLPVGEVLTAEGGLEVQLQFVGVLGNGTGALHPPERASDAGFAVADVPLGVNSQPIEAAADLHTLGGGLSAQPRTPGNGSSAPFAQTLTPAQSMSPLLRSSTVFGERLSKTGSEKTGSGPRRAPAMRKPRAKAALKSEPDAPPPEPLPVPTEAEAKAAVAAALAARDEAVLLVSDLAEAERVAELALTSHRARVFACDTEVMEIDVKKESPVGHGMMTCFTFYAGPDVDWGAGNSCVFVDLLGGGQELLAPFKSFFEDPTIKKVWHNYSFDRHILHNHGVDARGLHADTMHMARLYDSARDKKAGAGYSLESLTADREIMGEKTNAKIGMATLFGRPNIKKDGAEGKLKVLPPIEELQTAPETREAFVQYAAYDATATWQLWAALKAKLEATAWRGVGDDMRGTLWDCYERYYQPFGELLTDMERNGMLVDTDHLAKMEKLALTEQARAVERFRRWAAKRCPDAVLMNVGSDIQIRQLLFGGIQNSKPDSKESLPMSKVFKVPNTDGYIEPGREGKPPKKQRDITLTGLGVDLPVEVWTPSGWPAVSGPVLKALAGKVAIDWATPEVDEDDEGSFEPTDSDNEDAPKDDVSKYGTAYAAFGGGVQGKAACHAIAALIEVSAISTLLSGFIQPLQGDQMLGPDKRVHCSLNINTETGRLSARKPNLQNQPALEKDRYKIRQAFVASPGNTLIVADYGQLELRLLAHLADCQSMKDAFEAGGDFHSRTAVNMYAHVREAVERGEVLLEWDSKDGTVPAPAPMLKDVFGAERRKAKMLNFSIAYGKTAAGLSKDWKVTLEEAQETVKLWYAARQEVKRWQKARIEEAKKTGYVPTLLGRRRRLPDINSRNRLLESHMERAAINTPVQGSAADVAMLAMLELSRDARLAELGWRLLLQVHDEMILEGPEESADEALSRVVHAMAHPFDGENILKVALAVDAKHAKNWYAAK